MSKRILVLIGHPDPAPERLCRALAQSYAEGARAAGHSVQTLDVATLDIPILRTMAEFGNSPAPEALQPAIEALRSAEHVMIVFPLWLGTMPALLKAFLEQVMRPGVAFAYPQSGEGGFAKSLLKGRSARVVVTMGMPASFYRLWYLGHGVAGLRRNIFHFVGIAPVHQSLFGMVENAGPRKRASWLATMHRLGAGAQ